MSGDPLSEPQTIAGRLRRVVLAAAGRPRSPAYWRTLHWLISREGVIAGVAGALGLVGRERAEGMLNRFWELVVGSGWPQRERGWHNIDFARFVWRVRRRLARAPRRRPRRASRDASSLRIACVGPFAHLTSYGAPPLFALDVPGAELHVFDIEDGGALAPYLDGLAHGYRAYAVADRVERLAADVNALEPDLVLNFRRMDGPAFELVDRLEAPCVAHVCTGSGLLYHEDVDFFLHAQPEADYFVRDERLFSGLAHAPSGTERVFRGGAYWDRGSLDPRGARSWAEREPKIVVHGSLYKAASPAFLDVMLTLLREDAELELVLMGKDDGRALDSIRAAAARHGVGDRVLYEGAFSPVRGTSGETDDPMRAKMLAHLRTARLAPNPFPIGGGSSRAEAYGTGAPSVHLALRTDPDSWGKPQLTTVDAPFLNVEGGTAETLDEYLELCRRCLADAAHADRLAAAQAEAFLRLTDPVRWWAELLGFHSRWLASTRDGDES